MIEGEVDAIVAGAITGWAYSPDIGDDHLLVEAFVGGILRGSTFADRPRPGAEGPEAGHGFWIEFPGHLWAGDDRDVEVFATALDGERVRLGAGKGGPPAKPSDTDGRAGTGAPTPPPPMARHAGDLPLVVTATIERIGSRTFDGGRWVGSRGGRLGLCGLSIRSDPPVALEYRGFGPQCGDTGWVAVLAAGSPLSGLALRVVEPRYTVACRGRFRSGRTVGPVYDGAPCRSPDDDDVLAFVQISVRDREA